MDILKIRLLKAMVKCPACGREFETDPLKAWRFRFYQVNGYWCTLCGSKSGVYEDDYVSSIIRHVKW